MIHLRMRARANFVCMRPQVVVVQVVVLELEVVKVEVEVRRLKHQALAPQVS